MEVELLGGHSVSLTILARCLLSDENRDRSLVRLRMGLVWLRLAANDSALDEVRLDLDLTDVVWLSERVYPSDSLLELTDRLLLVVTVDWKWSDRGSRVESSSSHRGGISELGGGFFLVFFLDGGGTEDLLSCDCCDWYSGIREGVDSFESTLPLLLRALCLLAGNHSPSVLCFPFSLIALTVAGG